MNFLAIPIGLNGLVRPAPLAIIPDCEVAALKHAFADSAAVFMQLAVNHSCKPWQPLDCQDYKQAAAIDGLVQRFRQGISAFVNAGAEVMEAEANVFCRAVKRGGLQIETAGPFHVDDSAMRYQDEINHNRITLRGLFVSERSPVVCDTSGEPDPLASLFRGYLPDSTITDYRSNNLMRTPAEREFTLMDMMTPHSAQPVLQDTTRLLVDCRVRLALPDDWRMRAQYKLRY